ncbi:hypothetical protein HanIR_Chr16g0809761 [Helianthus annuus]|nr:hypothetical protein HanIR_Chr16g0809761 [Helianthus annuus]
MAAAVYLCNVDPIPVLNRKTCESYSSLVRVILVLLLLLLRQGWIRIERNRRKCYRWKRNQRRSWNDHSELFPASL